MSELPCALVTGVLRSSQSPAFRAVSPEGRHFVLTLPAAPHAFFNHPLFHEGKEINGQKEQSLGVSDRLDVRMTPFAPPFAPAFVVRLFDEVGEPLDGVELSFKRKPLMCSVMARLDARRTLGERCRSPLRPQSN